MLLQIVSLVLALIATHVLWKRWKYDLHKVPSPPGLPLLGHSLQMMFGGPNRSVSRWIASCLKELGYPKLMRIDMMGSPWLFVTDMNFIKDVMMSKTAPFPKNLAGGGFFPPMVGNDPSAKALIYTAGLNPYVKAVRRVYATAFQSKNLKTVIPKLNAAVDRMINIIEAKREEGPIDFQSLCVRMALDATGALSFETNLGGLDGSRDIYSLLNQATQVAGLRYFNRVNRTYCKLFPKSKEAQRQNAIVDSLTAEYDKLTKDVLEREDPPNGEEPIWFALKNLKDPETGKPIPYNSLLTEVATAVFSGMETTGHQLGWLFALLGCYPNVVEKLLEELEEHGLHGPGARDVAFEDLGELNYLNAFLKEALRFVSIISGSGSRLVPKDMVINGYRIPKGTRMYIPGNEAFNTEEEWGDPEVFRPERWLTDEDMSQKYHYYFSYGPRDCAGQKLAMLAMRVVVIRLIRRYELTLQGNVKQIYDTAKTSFAASVKDGLWIHAKPRSRPA